MCDKCPEIRLSGSEMEKKNRKNFVMCLRRPHNRITVYFTSMLGRGFESTYQIHNDLSSRLHYSTLALGAARSRNCKSADLEKQPHSTSSPNDHSSSYLRRHLLENNISRLWLE